MSDLQKSTVDKTHHDDEGVAVEESTVHVGNEADGGTANGRRDIVLVGELGTGEVVAHPADARDSDEQVL